MTDLLHITVGAAPTGGFNLTHELNLLKAAILYADRIKLCSLSSAMAVSLLYLSVIPDNEALELILYTAKSGLFNASVGEHLLANQLSAISMERCNMKR